MTKREKYSTIDRKCLFQIICIAYSFDFITIERKKRMKKRFTFIAVSVIVAGLLTGCGENQSVSQIDSLPVIENSTPEQSSADTNSSDTPQTGADEFEYTVKNKKVIIDKYIGTGTDVVIPDTIEDYPVTVIGESAFMQNTELVSVSIPDSVKAIEDKAFYKCSSLKTANLGNGIVYIGLDAFCDCTELNGIILPDNEIEISVSAFGNCESLTEIELPESLLSWGEYVFSECESLKSVTIPGGLSVIWHGAFSYCENLTDVIVEEGITKIEATAFYECTSLTSVTLPDSISEIEDEAFYECENVSITYKGETYTYDQLDLLYAAVG